MTIVASQYIKIGAASPAEKADATYGTAVIGPGGYGIFFQLGAGLAATEINKQQSQIGTFVELRDAIQVSVITGSLAGATFGMPLGATDPIVIAINPDQLTYDGIIMGIGSSVRTGSMSHYFDVTFKSLKDLWLELGKDN
jgi:hypothetical protein